MFNALATEAARQSILQWRWQRDGMEASRVIHADPTGSAAGRQLQCVASHQQRIVRHAVHLGMVTRGIIIFSARRLRFSSSNIQRSVIASMHHPPPRRQARHCPAAPAHPPPHRARCPPRCPPCNGQSALSQARALVADLGHGGGEAFLLVLHHMSESPQQRWMLAWGSAAQVSGAMRDCTCRTTRASRFDTCAPSPTPHADRNPRHTSQLAGSSDVLTTEPRMCASLACCASATTNGHSLRALITRGAMQQRTARQARTGSRRCTRPPRRLA